MPTSSPGTTLYSSACRRARAAPASILAETSSALHSASPRLSTYLSIYIGVCVCIYIYLGMYLLPLGKD